MFDEIEFSICAASSTRFIKHSNAQESPFILYFKMADLVTLVVLNELMDSDDEKHQRGKTRNWIKRRHERGYFNNIIQELRIEDRFGFREMFRMDVTDFVNILAKISDMISPKERLSGTNPVQADERLALTLRFLATGETFQSLSFQYRISLNAISCIVKSCCKAIVEQMASNFIKVPSTEAVWLDIYKRFAEKWNFPHALGAIDGKHFRIQKPKNGGSFYHPSSFADTILEDVEISEGEWRGYLIPDSFYSLQVPRTGRNVSLYAKSVREKFMDYFINDGAVEWEWKYC